MTIFKRVLATLAAFYSSMLLYFSHEQKPSTPPPEKTPYQVLHIEPNATDRDIATAYFSLSGALNPEENIDNPQVAQKIKELGDAYNTLRDPTLKAKYELFLVAKEDPIEINKLKYLLTDNMSFLNINKQDEHGNTPLHYLVNSKHPNSEAVHLLVNKGASTDTPNDSEQTPVYSALLHYIISLMRNIYVPMSDPTLETRKEIYKSLFLNNQFFSRMYADRHIPNLTEDQIKQITTAVQAVQRTKPKNFFQRMFFGTPKIEVTKQEILDAVQNDLDQR
jgi:curved DNA-binding protein CbpA